MKKYFQKWAWIFRPYETKKSADYHAGINLVHATLDSARDFDDALFTCEMITAKLRKRNDEIKRTHVIRAINMLQSYGLITDCGVVQSGSNHFRVLQNVRK